MAEEYESLNEEDLKEMKKYFDDEIWPKLKKDLKEVTKKEACFYSFVAGSDMMRYSTEKEMKEFTKEELSKMSGEEIEKRIKRAVDEDYHRLWENKTKVNGVWINDKSGEALK